MANSAHTYAEKHYNDQVGNVGTKKSRRGTVTFGSDYASAKLPLITAAELGITEVKAVIIESGTAAGTAIGASVQAVINSGASTQGQDFTLQLWNGTTAIGTVDESATTVDITVLGN